MFSTISWGNYFTWAGGILLCYYTGVALTCYRTEIRSLLSGIGKGKHAGDNYATDESPETISEMSARVIDEIRGILQEAGQGASKPELLKSINTALANYGGLRIPTYRSAMYDFIIREGQTICGVGISERELQG